MFRGRTGYVMDDYGNAPGFEVSDSRFAQVRTLREQRRKEREDTAKRQRTPAKASRTNASHANKLRPNTPHAAPRSSFWKERETEDPYAGIPPYENYFEDDFEQEEAPGGSLARVIAAQAVVCMVLLGGLFLCQKTMPNIYRQLKTAYTQTMRTDMSAQEVWAAAVQVFRTMKDEVYVIAPYSGEAVAGEAVAGETAQGSAADAKSEAAPETPASEFPATVPSSLETGTDAVGGMDVSAAYAEHNCSWAPMRTTVRPYPPIEQGRVTSLFGYRVHPISGDENIHTGLDIAADFGTPIHAAFFGTVAETGKGKEYGNYIIMEHAGGLRTLYAHCAEVLAEEGMVMRAGDVIALVGSTGASTGPHVHIEMRLDGIRCDPGDVLGV